MEKVVEEVVDLVGMVGVEILENAIGGSLK